MEEQQSWDSEDYLTPEEKAIMFENVEFDMRLGQHPPGRLLFSADDIRCIPQLLELPEAAYLIPYNNLYTEIKRLIRTDDKDQFASFLKANHDLLQSYPPREVLLFLCRHRAVRCLTALLQSRLHVDVNALFSKDSTPLHFAACHLSYGMTELLFQHGAVVQHHACAQFSPLRTALKFFPKHKNIFEDWTAEKSILKLLYLYCLPESKEPLDVIRLLASHSKRVDDLCMELMNSRRVEDYVALLMVAWDKINAPVWQYITRVLNDGSLQQKICEHTYPLSKENLVTNLSIALDVVKTMFRNIGVLKRYYHQSDHPSVEKKEMPFHLVYELVKNERFGLKPDGANLPCYLPRLISEAKVLPEQKYYSVEPRQFGSKLRCFVGMRATSSSMTPPLSSRFQYRTLNILNPMERHLCKTAQVKPSSHVLPLAKMQSCTSTLSNLKSTSMIQHGAN